MAPHNAAPTDVTQSYSDTKSVKRRMDVFKRRKPLTFSPTRQYGLAVISPLQKQDSRETVFADDSSSGTSSPAHSNDPYEGNPYEGNPYEGNPYEGNPYEGNPYEGNPYEGNPYEGNPYEGNPYEGNPYEGNPYEGNPYEGNPFEGPSVVPKNLRFKGYVALPLTPTPPTKRELRQPYPFTCTRKTEGKGKVKGHRWRCDRPKAQQKDHLAVMNNAFLETVATVNRAVGVQGRLEDNQERLVAAG
ncbi:unnamed protein product [Leuciscus chuanchicus]